MADNYLVEGTPSPGQEEVLKKIALILRWPQNLPATVLITKDRITVTLRNGKPLFFPNPKDEAPP